LTSNTLESVCSESNRDKFVFGDIGPDVGEDLQGCCCNCDPIGEDNNRVDDVRECSPNPGSEEYEECTDTLGKPLTGQAFRLTETWNQVTVGDGSCERDCYRAFGGGGTLTDKCLVFCRSQ
jgi:hypothetical protein